MNVKRLIDGEDKRIPQPGKMYYCTFRKGSFVFMSNMHSNRYLPYCQHLYFSHLLGV